MPTHTDTAPAQAAADSGLQAFAALAAPSASGPPPAWAGAAAALEAALQASNGQVIALKRALKATSDEELHQIAALGFHNLNGGHKDAVRAALAELERASGGDLAAARAAAKAAASAFKAHLDGDEAIGAIDDNPFGVAVTIRSQVGGALAALAAALD